MTDSQIDHVARAGLLRQGYPVHPEDFKDALVYVNAVERGDYAEADRLLAKIRQQPRHAGKPLRFVDIGE